MTWLEGSGAFFLFLWALAFLVAFALVAIIVVRWVRRPVRMTTFSASEPERKETPEYHFELEDVNDQPRL